MDNEVSITQWALFTLWLIAPFLLLGFTMRAHRDFLSWKPLRRTAILLAYMLLVWGGLPWLVYRKNPENFDSPVEAIPGWEVALPTLSEWGARTFYAEAMERKPLTSSPKDYRVFTSQDGRTIRAKLVGFDGYLVSIERDDGTVFTNPIGLYAEQDQAYIRDHAVALDAEDNAPAPSAPGDH